MQTNTTADELITTSEQTKLSARHCLLAETRSASSVAARRNRWIALNRHMPDRILVCTQGQTNIAPSVRAGKYQAPWVPINRASVFTFNIFALAFTFYTLLFHIHLKRVLRGFVIITSEYCEPLCCRVVRGGGGGGGGTWAMTIAYLHHMCLLFDHHIFLFYQRSHHYHHRLL